METNISPLKALTKKLATIVDAEEIAWLNLAKSQLAQLSGDMETTANKLVFLTSTVKRKLSTATLQGEINSGFNPDIYDQCNTCYLNHWSVTDAARIILFNESTRSELFTADELFQLCYRYSDEGERASLLKGLPLLNLTDQSTDFIIDIARTNSLEIFSALSYKNPWPVVKFPVLAFNQIVLKSLFMDINIIHIEGLRAARNPELGRMAADYAQERLDATREIPASIWLAVDVNLLTEQGLTALESTLQSAPTESKHQLALLGCHWQSDLPAQLRRIIQSLNL